MYEEALSHCRHTTTLKSKVIPVLNTQVECGLYENIATFEKVFTKVDIVCTPIFGIGNLTIYDLSVAIARKYGLQPSIIYCPGSGTQSALKLLGIRPINKKIGTRTIPSTTIATVHDTFNKKGYPIPEQIQHSKNSDDWESFLCNWQKQFKSGSATECRNLQHCTYRGTLDSQNHI